MDWLGQMLGLPQSFLFSGTGGGVIQGTTCETILCTLVAARDQMLAKVGRENIGKLVFYRSDQTHCALLKAAKLSQESLRTTIRLDVEAGLIPVFLCATIGTTSTTAVDPIRDSKQVVDYKDWQITLSRRFRSMKLWLVLRSYGVCNLKNFLSSHVKMARLFQLVESDNRVEKEPNGCNIEAKLVDPEYANAFNRNLLETMNASGKVFMTHTVVEGIYVITICCWCHSNRG
ncbi:tyrosine decarboxylase 1 isoform X3 [Gossypium australe]|uniref:Tyrosine decarboxylase 1 isoform X3 n=1 Tax=Gossypium australe TaxID=47621 RepID=A0A5B6WJN9_9ROSI|nr:tyrosine decarboxylase 1 isoform X3 [Gossypium australe]